MFSKSGKWMPSFKKKFLFCSISGKDVLRQDQIYIEIKFSQS